MNLMNEKKAAEYLGMSVGTLRNWRCNSEGPTYVKMSGAVRYRSEDLESYVEGNLVTPHGDA